MRNHVILPRGAAPAAIPAALMAVLAIAAAPARGETVNLGFGTQFLPELRTETLDTATLPAVTGQEVRVLVFPHLTAQPPQGRDAITDRVTLSTSGVCTTGPARLDPPGPVAGPGRIDARAAEFSRREFTTAALSRPLWVECTAPLRVERAKGLNSYRYEGAFLLRARSARVLEVINVLDMEQYLRGVVPIEMPVSWHAEALRAQAVAARTYAWFHVAHARREFQSRPWDMDDTVQYQAYTGIENRAATTDDAVAATARLTMFHAGGIIQAFFSADAGGHTEDASNVWPQWGEVPYCRGKPELWNDADVDLNRWGPWRATFAWDDFTRRLRARGLLDAKETAAGVEVRDGERFVSGRAREVRVRLASGGERAVLATELRRALGLRSTRLSWVASDAAGASFEGRGHGHGAGMGQLGAMTMATRYGWDFRRILEFYYTDIRIEPKP